MNRKPLLTIITFTVAVGLIFISEFTTRFVPGIQLNRPNISRLERKIEGELKISKKIASAFFLKSTKDCTSEMFEQGLTYSNAKLKPRDVFVYLFVNDSLCFWTSKIDISGIGYDTSKVVLKKIQSNFYFAQWAHSGKKQLLILNRFCSEFPYQNKYLQNNFTKIYREFNSYRVSPDLVYNGLPVRARGVSNFYLTPVEPFRKSTIETIEPIIQWTGFFLLVLSIYLTFSLNFFRKRIHLRVSGFVISVVLIRAVSIIWGLPVKPDGLLFGPNLFAHSAFNASLGDFLVNSILVFLAASYIHQNIIKIRVNIRTSRLRMITALTSPIAIAMFALSDGMLSSLVLHSTLTLETFRIFNISIYTILGYLSISLWVASAMVILNAWLNLFSVGSDLKWALIALGVGLGATAIFLLLVKYTPTLYGIVWTLLTLGIFLFLKFKHITKIKIWVLFLLLGILSVYTVATVSLYSRQKEEGVRKVLAINLSSERDPVAEMLIAPLYHRLLTDTLIRTYVRDINKYNVELYRYLRKNYFRNYLNRYELLATVCFPNSLVAVDATTMNCNRFFNDLVGKYGILIPSSRFFYLNLQNGYISYLGTIGYRYGDELRNLYIEISSRPSWELLGYPELLIEGHNSQFMPKGYSWAKYHKGNLITQAGDFPYSTKLSGKSANSTVYETYNRQGYNHLIYRSNTEDAIIISRPKDDPLNTTASFAYNLTFFFIVLLGLLKWANVPVNLQSAHPSFKNRIGWAVSFIVILSLFMVAAATIFYNIKSFNQRNEKNLGEKLLSVMFELNKNITLIYDSDVETDRLTDRLIDLSNIFYTDINIYDTTGMLMASSRPEMFEKQLLGHRMDPTAWNEMAYKHSPKYVNRENIGRMFFLSAYVPIVDSQNQTIAYLNLPYFTRQEELREELYSIIVAIVNIYTLLTLFAMTIAFLISGQITRPLELIRERISMVNIAGNNEPIRYSGNDEVGQLIGEYNRMVDELARSAKELAQSQRESAWREMAKQIAHEVKNPLTPIKLSLQYLIKAKHEGVADWDERFERFSQSLVEQINALSTIANEFSSFAKLPAASINPVNLKNLLTDVVTLYSGYKNMSFTLTNNINFEPIVMADREQLLRVFNNLVKNAIQSVEHGRQGLIDISINSGNDNFVKVEVSDNGTGIPDDILPKLFTPNFTTKSGGTGLGLAITREIVLGFGGSIKVKTKVNEGSTFMVELPLEKES